VAEDEREQGRRAILNYGHTFGHAFEAVTHYETFLHGEAIAIGMHAAAWMAARLGLVDQGFVDRQKACIERCGLPVNWSDLPVDAVIDAMKRDKKAIGGTLRFILPAGIGKVVQRTDIEADLVAETLARIKRGG
jgi:3-dehydroquinate synthase